MVLEFLKCFAVIEIVFHEDASCNDRVSLQIYDLSPYFQAHDKDEGSFGDVSYEIKSNRIGSPM